jgi:hypothetical protein
LSNEQKKEKIHAWRQKNQIQCTVESSCVGNTSIYQTWNTVNYIRINEMQRMDVAKFRLQHHVSLNIVFFCPLIDASRDALSSVRQQCITLP